MKTNSKILILFLISSIIVLSGFSAIATEDANISNPDIEKINTIIKDDELDQYNTEIGNKILWVGRFDPANRQGAQSFIPQKGILTRVELYLSRYEVSPASEPFYLAIREELTGDTLSEISVNPSVVPIYNFDWIMFDFPDISVNVGEAYYTAGHSNDNSNNGLYLWGGIDTNPYSNGMAFILDEYNPNWQQRTDIDTGFKTYGTVPDLEISNINGGIGKISADITNNLDHIIEGIDCTITVKGGILNKINIESDITIDSLVNGETTTISTEGFIFGLGSVEIEVTAVCDEVGEFTKTDTGLVLLFLIL
jgi:hypothetical protein